MSIMLLSRVFRQSDDILQSSTAPHEEEFRISAALRHIREHGNLDTFRGSRNLQLALTTTAIKRGLVVWDKRRKRYGLTNVGKQRLDASQCSD
jgi:hypothetical protein